MKRARIISVMPATINRIGASAIATGVGGVVAGAFSNSSLTAGIVGSIGGGMIMGGVAVCAELGTDTDPVMIPIPWPVPMPTVAVVEPHREPAAYPPAAGQCFVCGIIDPDREKSLGTATHPECVEWLGDWKPPVPQFERNRRPIIMPSAPGGITTAEFANNLRTAMGTTKQNTQYVFTCKCPDCENHWWFLRTAASGHPKDCRCTACEGVHDARTRYGPHHRNCGCHKCVKLAPAPVESTADAVRRNAHLCTVLCAQETHGDGQHDLCKCSTCVNNRGDSPTEQEIRAAYDDLNARYKTPVMHRNGHMSYRDMPPAQTLGYTAYPEHFELFEGVCVACKLIADYHARPRFVSKLPPFEPDPDLTRRYKE